MTATVINSASSRARLHRAIATLAIIKVNWDERRDYIANFVPLVGAALREAQEDEVSLGDVQERIHTVFGLLIPQGTLRTLLGRMAREGIVVRSHGVFRRVISALGGFDIAPARENAMRQHEALVDKLVDFACEEFGREWSRDDADTALLGVLESQAEHILQAAVEGQKLVELPRFSHHGEVVVNRFILKLCASDPIGMEYLETVVKGTMLANVLYLPKAFSDGTPKLKGTEIYFDTPFLLRALGFATKELQDPCVELLHLLRGLEAPLRVFEHTVREIEGVLDAAANVYKSGGRGDFPGDVVEYFVSRCSTASDVEMQIASLDARLGEFGVDMISAPDHVEALGLDEVRLEQDLKDTINYRNPDARVKDIKSLTAIDRLRGGELFPRLDQCPAIFVTTNGSLVGASGKFFRDTQGGGGMPLCILDYTLTAIVWLSDPTRAADLPRQQIVANSFAALNPPDRLWRKYLAEIRRLEDQGAISEEQVALLIFSSQARGALMDRTLGDSVAYVEGTVQQVLEFAEAHARAEAEALLAEREGDLAREQNLRRIAEQRVTHATEATERALRERRLSEEQRIHDVAKVAAKWTARVVFAAAALFVVLGSAFATRGFLPAGWSGIAPAFVTAAIILTAVMGVIHLISGLSVSAVVARLEAWLAALLENGARRLFLPND